MAYQRILVVTEHELAAPTLLRSLAVRGFRVTVEDGATASAEMGSDLFEVVLLDLTQPEEVGLEACRRIRAASGVPIILVVDPAAIGSVIRGIESGADDFIVRPFNVDSLALRIAVLRKRRETSPIHLLHADDLTIDLRRRTAHRGSRLLRLSRREFEILALLIRNQGICIGRATLAEQAGLGDSAGSLKVHICNLRSKLTENGEADIIESRRGFGYVLHSSGSQ